MSPRRARFVPEDADLREHLVAVTAQLLADEGLEGLTTRRIARAASVADGVLYNHFADKDDLILAGLVLRTATLLAAFDKAAPRAGRGTLEGNLSSLAAAILGLERALMPLLASMLGKRRLLERFLGELHSPELGGADRVLRTVHDYLAAERDLGRVSADADSHLVGVLLFAIAQLQALAMQVRDPHAPPAKAVRQLRPFIHFLAANLADPTAT
jgi:AcrR family transcriptional regulator